MNKKLFSAMSRRRVSCPLSTQQLWDAIKIIRYKRQVANLDRITKYMTRVHGVTEDEVARQISYCVRDGLLKSVKKVVTKGSKVGDEQEGYSLPEEKVEKDSHDWYCFECHSAGDVICCTSCHRVYHLSCMPKDDLPDDVKNKFICKVCKRILRKDATPDIKRSQLNRLLKHTAAKLKDRLPVALTDRQIPSNTSYISERFAIQAQVKRPSIDVPSNFKWLLNDKDDWRVDNLIYKLINLPLMESKADCGKYEHLEEFRADVQTIVHDVVIYHGVNSSMADMARLMLRDCITDMQEIMECWLCYKHSNDKSLRNWFCKPCRPPHELVYAKSKGCPYWPAKVLKKTEDTYEIRYFGQNHDRAVVEKSHIRPISVNIHTLQVKGNSGWNKAREELKRYQRELEKNDASSSDSSSDSDDTDDADDEDSNNSSSTENNKDNNKPEKLAEVKKQSQTVTKEQKKPPKMQTRSDVGKTKEIISKPDLRRGRPRKCAMRTLASRKSDDEDEDDEDEDDEENNGDREEEKSNDGAIDTGNVEIKIKRKLINDQDDATIAPTDEKKRNVGNNRNSDGNFDRLDAAGIPKNTDVLVTGQTNEEKPQQKYKRSGSRILNDDSIHPNKKVRSLRTSANDFHHNDKTRTVGGSASFDSTVSTEDNNITSSSSGETQQMLKGNEEEIVSSSSSQNPTKRSVKIQTKFCRDWLSKMEKHFEEEKNAIILSHQQELELLRTKHAAILSEAKKKQWCVNCEQEAIYHCCWNTSYCSLDCQLQHWAADHKRHCRRKR